MLIPYQCNLLPLEFFESEIGTLHLNRSLVIDEAFGHNCPTKLQDSFDKIAHYSGHPQLYFFLSIVVFRQIQEIELDKHIRLLDSPGVVLAVKNKLDAVEVALKNAIRVDSISDPVAPVQAILRRCRRETVSSLCSLY